MERIKILKIALLIVILVEEIRNAKRNTKFNSDINIEKWVESINERNARNCSLFF